MIEESIENEKMLRDEIKQLNAELKEVNEKLQKSESFKSHFISNITNEIINPFTSIIGIAKNIMQLNHKQIGQIHSMANLIYNEAFDLDFQLKNIFEAAKIEAGETEIEAGSIDIRELIANVLERFRFKAEKKSLYFDFPTQDLYQTRFVSDSNKLQTIISNLISNAIKFSTEKNKIVIRHKIEDNILTVNISNTGIALSGDDIKVMFDRFSKLDNNINSLNQGHGLGLSVVGAYVEILEGQITIESANGINTVSLSLPELQGYDADFQAGDTEFFDNEIELF